jgi:trigger factor
VNVTIESLSPCKKLARFEVPAADVDKAFDQVTKDFCKHAAMPGFRPGKAPEAMVLKQYETDIADQVKGKLMGDTYRQAIKDHHLEVLGQPDVEEVQFGKGQPMIFTATVETAPEFELPEYRGLPARREHRSVSDEDITKAIDVLRTQAATFETLQREVAAGDYVVVNFTGTCDGKPIIDTAPTARGLNAQKNFWVEVKPDSFIPGFAMQLVGAKAGDARAVAVDFPADFVTPQLAGKKGEYQVEVVEVKERKLPELNDALAAQYGAENLEKLREGVRQDLQNELNAKNKRSVRNQIVRALLDRVHFELPDVMVQHETRNVVYDIVSENQQRGIPSEMLEQQKDQIYSAANQSAKERVKIAFIFQKIAAKEGIRTQKEDLNARVVMLAQSYKMAPAKFLKELEKRDGLPEIVQQIVHEKVIDFLEDNATIENAPAPAPAPAEA